MIRKSEMNAEEMTRLVRKAVVRFSLVPIFLGIMVLLPAGTFRYWEAYVYFVILIVPMFFVLLYFFKNDPKFLERRTRSREKDKRQKVIVASSTTVFLAAFVIPGLDQRFNWSIVPPYIVISADFIVLIGYLMVFFVFKANSYASRIIEVIENQKVISTGFYRYVRHPMYLGVLIMFLPTPIALGSYWALIALALLPVVLASRIISEEKTLLVELPGYKEYCQKTRYRLLPLIW